MTLAPGRFTAERVDGMEIVRKHAETEEQLLWRISEYEGDLAAGRRSTANAPQIHEQIASAP